MKYINKINKNIILIIIMLLAYTGCDKELDRPPLDNLDPQSIITIDSLISIYDYYGEAVTFDEEFFQDEEKNPSGVSEYNIYSVITMGQESGNIYNAAYMQDETEAINVRFSRTNVRQNDSIRINLKGTTVSMYRDVYQLDSVDAYKHIIRLEENVDFPPEEVGIADILSGGYLSKLVKLNDVQFIEAALGSTFADAANLEAVNLDIEDCYGNVIEIRTSGYADFANKLVPEGNGSLIAVVGLWRPEWNDYDTWQLYIRNYDEVEMDGPRCGDVDGDLILSEDFADGTIGEPVNFNGWSSELIEGSKNWVVSTSGSDNFAQISPYGSGDESNIAWMISPSVSAQSYQNVALNFKTAHLNYQHDGLQVFISYDYNGSDPVSASWTELTDANFASDINNSDTWVGSGTVNISNNGQSFYLGFKYTGSDADGLNTAFRVDDVKVYGVD